MNNITNIFIDIKLIIKQMILHNKYIFRNKLNIIFMLLIILIAISFSVIFIPITYGFSLIIQLSTLIPIGMVYISISYEWRNSTLYSNLLKTRNNKILFNISIISTMMIFMFILTFITLLIVVVANQFHLILTTWFTYGGREAFSLFGKWYQWDILLYTQIINVILMFALCFFVQSFAKSSKLLYVFLLMIMILLIIFGGSLNDYFDAVNPIEQDANDKTIKYAPRFNPALFPPFLYFPSLLFPFYSNGQILSFSIDAKGPAKGISDIWIWLDNSTFTSTFTNENPAPKWIGPWTWNILWLMPWIQIFGFLSISIIIRKL